MSRRFTALVLVLGIAVPARAAVTKIDILERAPFAGGMSFGDAGPYEKFRGIAHFALDPNAPANAAIVDLKRAPRDAQGFVTFSSEFVMLRPAGAKSSTLIYDVNNRGHIGILGQMDGKSAAHNDPTTVEDAGDGFLMRHGFTLLFSAWTWDVAPGLPGDKPLVFAPPIAHHSDGSPISGPVENEFTVNAPADVATYAGIQGLTYEPATPDDPEAVLTMRASCSRAISGTLWHRKSPADRGAYVSRAGSSPARSTNSSIPRRTLT